MKKDELWKSYVDYTKTLSDNTRALGFAAGGICWFFKTNTNCFPSAILWSLGLVVTFFIFDIIQYLASAILLRLWTRDMEKKKHKETGSIEGDYDKPAWLDYPAYTFWWMKILSLLLAFILIGRYIWVVNSGP